MQLYKLSANSDEKTQSLHRVYVQFTQGLFSVYRLMKTTA